MKQIGIDDNFFELGGHSLLALKKIGEIEKVTGKLLPLVTLLTAQTIRRLSQSHSPGRIQTRAGPHLYRFNRMGVTSRCFWSMVSAERANYRHFGEYLGPDQPLYGLQSYGLDGTVPPLATIPKRSLYIKEIQTIQPSGPYHLGGGSFGGIVAFEMAHQLRAQGMEVALLALLDSVPPWHDGQQKTPKN